MNLRDLGQPPRKPRKVPPRTVKGQDIELWPEDGQRFHPSGPPEPPSPKGLVETTKGMEKPGRWFLEQWRARSKKR